MNSLHATCPGRGESRPHACRCGAMITTYRGYETTAQLKAYNLDGTRHQCPPLPLVDIIECICGIQVYRDQAGKRNMDGSAHVCGKPVAAPAPRVAQAEITEPPVQHKGWRVPTTTVIRG